MKTKKEVSDQFHKEGITVSAWARSNGFKPHQVRDVLRGKAKGKFGAAHKISVALGIKEISQRSLMLPEGAGNA